MPIHTRTVTRVEPPGPARFLAMTALLSVAMLATAAEPRKQPAVGELPPDALGKDRDGIEQTVGASRQGGDRDVLGVVVRPLPP